MSYASAVLELRQLMSDSDMHKKSTKKKLIGKIDGNNVEFYTYDKRIVGSTLELFVTDAANNEAQLLNSEYSLEDPVKGFVKLEKALDPNSKITGNYYWQFWIDSELKNFLNKGAESIGQFTDSIPDNTYMAIQAGLRQAALFFAAHLCVNSLIQLEMNRRHSEEFLIEQDGNDDKNFTAMITAMRGQSKDYWDRAVIMRDDFHKRVGKRNAPAFAIKLGSVRRYGANR